ncbi:MAG: hypothetical protein PF485_07035 [Bacteroidales bacterium]|jgi:hypothetical protein|nr:hypothetical protein [Bacteroidales bacterium]
MEAMKNLIERAQARQDCRTDIDTEFLDGALRLLVRKRHFQNNDSPLTEKSEELIDAFWKMVSN